MSAPPPPPPSYQESNLHQEVPPPPVHDYEGATREFLTQNNWPRNLQDVLLKSNQILPLRFVIIDDSGSMSINDGHRLVYTKSGVKSVTCSRWQELMEGMQFHTKLAEVSGAITEFRLLNGAPPVVIGRPDGGEAYASMQQIMQRTPGSGTPLCRHIREVIAKIREIEPQLRANGHKAVVVIATDGESSDGDIVQAMKPLHDLPVWVVIRLCTDDDNIVNYWNNIDSQLELEMDILDDLFGEAAEVNAANPWMTYAEPMHRLREWGVHLRELDLIDEGKLAMRQMYTLVNILTPTSEGQLPDPDVDFKQFYLEVERGQAASTKVLNVQTMKYDYWIRCNKLKSMYGPSGCSIS